MITTPLDDAAPAVPAGAAGRPAPRTVGLSDGRRIRIRQIRPSEAAALREFDDGLCETCPPLPLPELDAAGLPVVSTAAASGQRSNVHEPSREPGRAEPLQVHRQERDAQRPAAVRSGSR